MTVEELIERLEELPGHYEVYYDDATYGEVEPCFLYVHDKVEEVVIS